MQTIPSHTPGDSTTVVDHTGERSDGLVPLERAEG
jgi:hypothetical protein